MPRLAANISMMYTELPFMQRFEAAAKDGFRGVEFMFAYAYSAAAMAAQLQQHGLQQVLLNAPPGGGDNGCGDVAGSIATAWNSGMRGTACLPGREAEFQSGVRLALQYAQQLGCPRIHLMAGIAPTDAAPLLLLRTYVRNLRWAARLALDFGCEVLIEPINTFDMPGYYLNHQTAAHAVLAEVAAPNCKVQMDLYHCHRMQTLKGGLEDRLESLADNLHRFIPTGNVAHLQIAGVPGRHEPEENAGSSTAVPWQSLLVLIDSLGYSGWIGCEYRPQAGTSAGLAWARPWL